jgi:NDP-sugar pyrophosphorylase family protein
MKAMILAAGYGTRLKPLTDNYPKALIPLAGKPLLFYVLEKLKKAGVKDIIINVHHQAQMIIDYLKEINQFDLNIEISHEEELLDTGGGLKKAAWFFEDEKTAFFLHNVDVLSSINLSNMMKFHLRTKSLATLAVKKRKTSRYLLFDAQGNLTGWQSRATGETEVARNPHSLVEALSFLGVHVLSPKIFNYLPVEKNFSIIKAYLTLARQNKSIRAYDCQDDDWFDLGRKENFGQAAAYLGQVNKNHGKIR